MATDVQMVAATAEHLEALAASMRAADVAEVLACGLTPLSALQASMERADIAIALLFDGQVAAVCGRSTQEAGEQWVWALTSTAVEKHKREFLNASRWLLVSMLPDSGKLWNCVDARYTASLRWARWLGFEVHPVIPFGPEGLPFHPISISKEDCPWAQ